MLGTVVGLDVAGIVEAVADGERKHEFNVGDAVYGYGQGSLAEFVIVKAGQIASLPKGFTFVQAAAMPITYITGLQGLREHGGLKSGGRLLIIGASGGCGTAAIQLAKGLGASEIVGVCSGKNEKMVRELGATAVVDYNKSSFADVYGNGKDHEKFDVVYDAASSSGGGENYRSESFQVLRSGGKYVPINGSPLMWLRYILKCQAANTHLFGADVNTRDLRALAEFSVDGFVKPVIAKTLPFTGEDLKTGFGLLKSRRSTGKIVFDMTLPTPASTKEVVVLEAGWISTLIIPDIALSILLCVVAAGWVTAFKKPAIFLSILLSVLGSKIILLRSSY